MKKKPFYITTPIYYPSGKWHLGHSYTTVICDAITRYKKMQGFDTFFLTGTDEHGQKIEERAAAASTSPKEFVDGLVAEIRKLWETLDISYDKFIRTTDEYHVTAVQRIFKALYDKGEIYKSDYEGKYCAPCESFWTKTQAKDDLCPDCGREVKDAKEECYFFRLSKYRDRLKKLLRETDFLSPSSRVNEMVNNFLDKGLDDLAVSRTSFKWGIPVTFDEKHIVYVWIDALSNYITALGATSSDDSLMSKYWPCDLHVVGKEIVRFHALIWPAILMALDLPLPKKVYGHGWLLLSGDKMSKSKGNVVDPFILCDRYGSDAVRYYILREVPFGNDGVYSDEVFLKRINSDLCNDLGNLLSRTTAMSKQYFDGTVTNTGCHDPLDDELIEKINGLAASVEKSMDALEVNKALEKIFGLVSLANKYIDLTTPWKLAKEETQKLRLEQVLFNLHEALRVAGIMLSPFLVRTSPKIFEQIGAKNKDCDYAAAQFGAKKSYSSLKGEAIFPRLNVDKEVAALAELANPEKKETEKLENTQNNKASIPEKNEISIDDFSKVKLISAKVLSAEKVEKADKLLKLTVDDGSRQRTVVSGIALSYSPEEMVGKTVVLVANLAPAKLRGIVSEGMILCATGDDGKVVLVSPESVVAAGAEVR